MNYLLLVINWIVGVLFMVCGILSIPKIYLGALSLIVVSFLYLPPAKTWFFPKYNNSLSGSARFAITLWVLLIGVIVLGGISEILKGKVVAYQQQMKNEGHLSNSSPTNIKYDNKSEEKLLLSLGCTKLPEQEKREIVGIWINIGSRSTTSIEKWNNKIFEVYRSEDRSGGDWGKELIYSSGYYMSVDDNLGEKYKILDNGKLGLYNHEGLILTLDKHNKLWP